MSRLLWRGRPAREWGRSHLPNLSRDVDFNTLIPEMKAWNNGTGIDLASWIQCLANHKILVACARILWPSVVEHDGCILPGDSVDEDRDQGFLKSAKGDQKVAAATMNHRHLLHLFGTELPDKRIGSLCRKGDEGDLAGKA